MNETSFVRTSVGWRCILALSATLLGGNAKAQSPCPSNGVPTPSIAWQQSLVRTGAEIFDFPVVRQLADGGFVLLARTVCAQGGCTNGFGGSDAYVARFDASGQKLWEQIVGGDNNDFLTVITPTPDGGFLLAGISTSPASGNKRSPRRSEDDAWVVRLDSSGRVTWDQTYAIAEEQEFSDIAATSDSGFIAVGAYELNDDDAGYAVRVNATGETQWERTFPYPGEAEFSRVLETADGGFAIGGSIESNTSPDGFWLVRLAANGDRQWQKFYGTDRDTLRTLLALPDGGFLLGGFSSSPTGGDKTSSYFGEYDAWIVRVDQTGNKLWDRAFGGTGTDYFLGAAQSSDGGFILAGSSGSEVSGNKTSPNFGVVDYWVVGTDANGGKLWERSYGGSENDLLWSLAPTDDGFLLAGASSSPPSGNKTSLLVSEADVWLVRVALLDGCDADGDGVADEIDECPDTPLGHVVNAYGCSLAQLVPCDGPWRNHGQYVLRVVQQTKAFYRRGLITSAERKTAIRAAFFSECGRKRNGPTPPPPIQHGAQP